MAASKGDVELIIRAKNEATKNLDAVNKSLKSLSDQQTIVGESAGKADSQMARLGLELARLRTNAANLQSLGTIAEVINKATEAMNRQKSAADGAATELGQLQQRQAELVAKQQQAAAATKTATDELKKHEAALKADRAAMNDARQITTALTASEKSLQASLASATATLERRKAALVEAETRQQALSAAIAASDKVTKAQQNSLDAATRSMERRKKALDEVTAKEADLRAKLTANQASMANHTAAALNSGSALAEQAAKAQNAKTALATAEAAVKALAAAERQSQKDIAAASTAASQQAAALAQARAEMDALTAASNAAKAAVNGAAAGNKNAASTAQQAAFAAATFAARLAALSGAAGARTSNPLGIDPAAIRTASGLIAQMGVTIRLANNETTRASVSAAELAAALKGVGQAKAQLEGIGQAIKSQQAAVNGAQAAWKAAEAEVKRLAISIKATSAPSAELAAAFGRAQGAAKNAKDEFIRQGAAAQKMGTDLQSAGIGAGTLSSAEAALAPRIQSVNNLLNQGQAAAQRFGGAAGQAGNQAGSAEPPVSRLANALRLMVAAANGAAGATNPLSRFKSELLGVVAAGAGLYGIKTQLESIWQAGADLEGNKIRFASAFGGVAEGAKELDYAREVALNLKLPIGNLVKSYSELALAAKGTSLEGEGARKIFTAFAQSARVNQMSNEQLKGTFNALTQIVSKGTVSLEELRQQLGDRLPGAIQLMAKAVGVTDAALIKMVSNGEVSRDALLNMAAVVSERAAPQLAKALDSPAAKLDDFRNRVYRLKETVATSGFLDALGESFDRMAKALSQPEAIDAAQKLGQLLGDLVTWATQLVSSGDLDSIANSFKALGAAWVALQIGSLVTGLYGFATAIGVTAIAVLGLDVALSPILVGMAALAAVVATVVGAFGLWKLAEWAYNNFPAFAEGVLKVKTAALESWDAILEFWELTAAKLTNSFTKVTANLANIWYGMINGILGAFPKLTETLGMGDYAAKIAEEAAKASAGVEQNETNLQATLNDIRSRYAQKEVERQKGLQDDIANYHLERLKKEGTAEEQAAKARAALAGPGAQPTVSFPTGGSASDVTGTGLVTAPAFVKDTSKADEAARKKAARERLTLEKSVTNEMYNIRSQLEKKSAADVEAMVAAVPAKYEELYDKLRKLGKDNTSEEWRTVDALVAQEQQNIRIAQTKKAATAAASAARKEEAANNKAIRDHEQSVTDLVKTRQALIGAVNAEQKAGIITQQQAYEKINEINSQMAPNIQAAADAAIQWAQANAAIFDTPEKQALFISQMKVAAAATKEAHAAFADLGNVITNGLVQGGVSGFEKMTDAIGALLDDTATLGETFKALGDIVRTFFADLLMSIAKAIVQQLILNAVSGMLGGASSGATTGGVASLIGAMFHNGGTVGSGTQSRTGVNPAIFAGAGRMHTGGVAGIKSDEVPAILQVGETVRTQQQEKALGDRMAMAQGAGGGDGKQSIKIVNQIDSGSVVKEGLSSSDGEKAVMNFMKANRGQLKQILG